MSSFKRDPPKREVPNLFPSSSGPKKDPVTNSCSPSPSFATNLTSSMHQAPKKARAIDTLLEEMKVSRDDVDAQRVDDISIHCCKHPAGHNFPVGCQAMRGGVPATETSLIDHIRPHEVLPHTRGADNPVSIHPPASCVCRLAHGRHRAQLTVCQGPT